MFDMLKDTQNSPSLWFNVVLSLKKARNEQANLQLSLREGAEAASPKFLSLIVSKLKKTWKGLFQRPRKYFLKKWSIFKRGVYKHVC